MQRSDPDRLRSPLDFDPGRLATDLAAVAGAGWILHMPVTTNEGVGFRLNGTRCPMPVGSGCYLRLSDPHSVANRGDSDRVQIFIDATVNGWLTALTVSYRASPPV